jgi:hypothetical protein
MISARFPARLGVALMLCAVAAAQSPLPDLIYYTFDEGGGSATANLATPGVGSNPATVNAQTLAPSGGQFGGALFGVGGNGTTAFVDTGWPTQLPGSFTIAFWLDLTAVTTTTPFMYVFGESTNSLRCFTNGAAGAGGITLRSSFWSTGVVVPGGATTSGAHHVAFVHDASVSELRGFLDGVRVATAPVAAATYSGVGFEVGTWTSVTSLLAGARVDEFRLYSRALTDAEIAATWNITLVGAPAPIVYCTVGTTSNGCNASIGWSGTPSSSAATSFTIDVSGVEGQRTGLLFYGLDNASFVATPWGQSSSFLCVKAPTQRTLSHGSGGTVGLCDGALALD